jgi:hypothetical protein
MTWLAENALPIWMMGAVAMTMAFIVFFQVRSRGAMWGVVGVAATVAALLAFNWFVETPRESVERELYRLAAAVEANDVPGALAFLSQSLAPNGKELRKDIESVMPQVKIDRARVMSAPEIEVSDDGKRATVKCRGIIVAIMRRDGMKGAAEDRVTMEWERSGDRWLVRDFVAEKNWGGAVNRATRSAPAK